MQRSFTESTVHMYIMHGVICHILAKALMGHVYSILIHYKKKTDKNVP